MKRYTRKPFPAILSLILVMFAPAAMGQEKELKKEVEVVKPYEPTVPEVFKINEMPRIKEREPEKPVFDYSIHPAPVSSSLEVEPVQAARMVDEPEAQAASGLLKAGAGNYNTPYGELFYNAQAGKKTAVGLHLEHLSSNGKVRLKNGDKVKAPSSENLAELFVNHSFRDSTGMKAKIFFERTGLRYYGYAGDRLDDAGKDQLIPMWNDRQTLTRGGVELSLDGEHAQGVNYRADVLYQRYTAKTGQEGSLARLSGELNMDFDLFTGKLDAILTVDGTDNVSETGPDALASREKALLQASPSIQFGNELAAVKLGIHAFTITDKEKVEDFTVTPDIYASLSPVKNWFTLFAGVNGRIQQNHYLEVAGENPYVSPWLNVKYARYRYILTGGFRGRISNQWSYHVHADYSSIRDDHFYILRNRYRTLSETETELISRSNTFDVVYDKVKQLRIGGEIHYVASQKLDFLLKGDYYAYDTSLQAEAWQKPEAEGTASVRLRPEGPFSFTADIYVLGKRKALITNELLDPQTGSYTNFRQDIWKMDPVLDLNFSIAYEFSPSLSFWSRVNNFSAQKYDRWQGYTSKGVNVLLGLSFAF